MLEFLTSPFKATAHQASENTSCHSPVQFSLGGASHTHTDTHTDTHTHKHTHTNTHTNTHAHTHMHIQDRRFEYHSVMSVWHVFVPHAGFGSSSTTEGTRQGPHQGWAHPDHKAGQPLLQSHGRSSTICCAVCDAIRLIVVTTARATSYKQPWCTSGQVEITRSLRGRHAFHPAPGTGRYVTLKCSGGGCVTYDSREK